MTQKKLTRKKSNKILTAHIMIDPRRCIACWKCMAECPNGVIGRVNLPWHKHVLIRRGGDCSGCGKCIKTCPKGVFYKM